jgi:uncharacterized NAD(P)/FAD-binding protein YdhS
LAILKSAKHFGEIMPYQQSEIKEYLRYFNEKKNVNEKPTSFGDWLKARRKTKEIEDVGGSKQMRKQLSTVSDADYQEIMKTFGRK